jgi:hypothetical protein
LTDKVSPSGTIVEKKAFLWESYDHGRGVDTYLPICPEYEEGKFQFFVCRTWLIHKLIFMTIFKYAKKKPIHKNLLVRGVGQPSRLSQMAGIMGKWESVGFLKKIGKGKTALYYFDPAVYDFSWQGKTERDTSDFRHILSYAYVNERFIEQTHIRALNNKIK